MGGVLQDVENGDEVRLVAVDDYAGVGRYGQFAVGEGVERIDRHVRADARGEFDEDLHVGGGIVLYFFDPDLTLFHGFQDAVDQAAGRHPVGQFPYGDEVVVDLFDLGADLDAAAALSPLVVGYVDAATGREIRVDFRLLALKDFNALLAQFNKIVR